MSKGDSIKDWIKTAELSKEYKREPFFKVFVQAECDNGSCFVVIVEKNSDAPMKGGLITTAKELERLKELGVEQVYGRKNE